MEQVSDPESFLHVIRCRGLPWEATKEDITRFFHDCSIKQIIFGKDKIGRASGEAFVSFESPDDIETAMSHHKEHINKRYIEVHRSSAEEYEWFRTREVRVSQLSDAVVHIRGLPFGCVDDDVEKFFEGFSIGPNGIVILTDAMGRITGEAFVQFTSNNVAASAIGEKNMKKMGHRYLELFPSSMEHAQRALMRQEEKNISGVGDSFSGRRGRGGPLRSHQTGGRSAPYARPGMNAGSGMGGGGYDFQGSRFSQGQMNNSGGFDNMTPMGFGRGSGQGFGRGGGGSFGNNTGSFGNSPGGFGNNPGGSGFGNFNRNSSQGFGRQQGFGAAAANGSGDAFQSSGSMNQQGYGNSGQQGSCIIHMRGLPYSANTQDVYDFFGEFAPMDVEVGYKPNGMSTGEADAMFANYEQAMRAMSKNGMNMGTRYIELFIK